MFIYLFILAVYGNIGGLNDKCESFEDYCDLFDTIITYKLLKNLCSPDTPHTKGYAEIKKVLKDHFDPAPITIAEWFKFCNAWKRENKIVSSFVRL